MSYMDLAQLSDEELFAQVEALAQSERFNLVDFLLHIGELDRRGICQALGYASMFAYLTRHMGYAESDAVRRVRVLRTMRSYPPILSMLAQGELHLIGLSILEPVLTPENHKRLLAQAARMSTRDVARLAAGLSPAAAEPRDSIRVLPSAGNMPGPAAVAAVPAPPAQPAPAEPARERLMFTFAAGEEVQSWFEEARDLLRHKFPSGRMEEIVGEALRRLVEDVRPEPRGAGAAERLPAASSLYGRYIPKWVRDAVWRRDCGRCSFRGPDGTRCGETSWLEWDHVIPWGLGGRSNDPSNIRLLCRAHNQSEARRVFGAGNGPGQSAA